jgi:hypothetical protein
MERIELSAKMIALADSGHPRAKELRDKADAFAGPVDEMPWRCPAPLRNLRQCTGRSSTWTMCADQTGRPRAQAMSAPD